MGYTIHGNRKELNVEEAIDIDLENVPNLQNRQDYNWFYEEVKYELYNEDEVVEIIDDGL